MHIEGAVLAQLQNGRPQDLAVARDHKDVGPKCAERFGELVALGLSRLDHRDPGFIGGHRELRSNDGTPPTAWAVWGRDESYDLVLRGLREKAIENGRREGGRPQKDNAQGSSG